MVRSSEVRTRAKRSAFGAQLLRFREVAGLTQEELAGRSGLTANTIGALERGEHRHPYPATIRALATGLGLIETERAALTDAASRRHAGSHTEAGRSSAVPEPLNALIGREQEIAAILVLMRQDRTRLVTLTGPGGIGKTRLALAIGAVLDGEFPGRVLFTDLSSLRDPTSVVVTVADQLGIRRDDDHDLFPLLASALGKRPSLMVVDNFEQLVDAAPVLGDLIATCPHLRLLVTSRIVLNLSCEQVYSVPALALPEPDMLSRSADLALSPAVRLFAARAHAADPDFRLTALNLPAVAAICHRLEGLPLAIELAASRTRHLPPAGLLARLVKRLPLLTGGSRDQPARQQTMRDAIAWSDELLPDGVRLCFRRLSVFSGGFTLEAGEAVVPSIGDGDPTPSGPGASMGSSVLDAIADLVDASLLRPDFRDPSLPRYRMLDTIREYGLEQLAASGEERRARDAHATFFAALDGRLDPNRVRPGELFDDRLWQIEVEYPNLRDAVIHLHDVGSAEDLLRLAGGLAIFWHHRGHLDEGRRWLDRALSQTPPIPTASRARALAGLSLVVWSQGDFALALQLALASRSMAEHIEHREITALAIHLLALVEIMSGRVDSAGAFLEDALIRWRQLDLPSSEAMAQLVLSKVALAQGSAILARNRADTALRSFRNQGHSSGAATSLEVIAGIDRDRGETQRAVGAYQDAIALWGRVDCRWSAARDDFDRIDTSLFPRWAGIEDRRSMVGAFVGLALIAASVDQPELAAILLGAGDRRIAEMGSSIPVRIRAARDRATERAAGELGLERFDEAHERGGDLSFNETVEIATMVAVPEDVVGPEPGGSRTSPQRRLTSREVEVLRLLTEQASTREIAATLSLSPRTVSHHLAGIFVKLGVQTRLAAAAIAQREGLV